MNFKFHLALVALVASVPTFAAVFDQELLHLELIPPCGNMEDLIPLLRAFSSTNTDHFYTASDVESQQFRHNYIYIEEGTTGYLFPSHVAGTIPLYRLWNSKDFDHFYTSNATEQKVALSEGYVTENTVGFIYPDSRCGGLPLYRLYNNALKDHLYTLSKVERDKAIKDQKYILERSPGYLVF
ncbi:hypothetical protein BDQ12DRAFT_714956 [Crucibulum laeve]|uniref:DUF5648 domain-containing protein n=1 Tax=Crucibulum laeve TaxID=68775 RepID=A0A5C3LQA5_9AGAR|nr:hypothetical protein BDQ12DRAFT_714956 [Crucibulum laeve]